MIRPGLAAAFFALGCSLSAAEPQELPLVAELGEPVKLVRTLEHLQDQIATGKAEAEVARRTLVDAIGARLLAAPSDTWADVRNRDAALVYVLSGGPPAVLERLPRYGDQRDQLIAAVRAAASGAGPEAMPLWNAVDPETLPRHLVAPVALAKAIWLIPTEPAKAERLLDVARLNAPGTLIEESAIRRGIEIAAKRGDAERFERLAICYSERFPRSMYAEAFRARFADFYLSVTAKAGDDPAEMLDEILSSLSEADRRDSYLEIARLALVKGQLKLARSAATRALTLGPAGADRERAELYLAAALAILDDPTALSPKIESVRADALAARDQTLLKSVLATVDSIHAWPRTVEGTPPPANPPEGGEVAAPPTGDTSATMDRTRDALRAAQELLNGKPGTDS